MSSPMLTEAAVETLALQFYERDDAIRTMGVARGEAEGHAETFLAAQDRDRLTDLARANGCRSLNDARRVIDALLGPEA